MSVLDKWAAELGVDTQSSSYKAAVIAAKQQHERCIPYACRYGNCTWNYDPQTGTTPTSFGKPGCPCDDIDAPQSDRLWKRIEP